MCTDNTSSDIGLLPAVGIFLYFAAKEDCDVTKFVLRVKQPSPKTIDANVCIFVEWVFTRH